MNSTKVTGKIIGEVEKITGIPKRDPKYYIKQRTGSGYWTYNDEDIQKARLAFLCRSLDFPVKAIRAILTDPAVCWREELERQIVRLEDRLNRTEAQLRLAQRLQGHGAWEALQIYCDSLERQNTELAVK